MWVPVDGYYKHFICINVMDRQKMEVVFLIDPLGIHKFFINERDQSLPQLSIWRGSVLPLSPRAILASLLAVCVDIYFGYPSLKTTALSYISPNKLLFSSDLKVKDGGRTASFQH